MKLKVQLVLSLDIDLDKHLEEERMYIDEFMSAIKDNDEEKAQSILDLIDPNNDMVRYLINTNLEGLSIKESSDEPTLQIILPEGDEILSNVG